MLLNRSDSLHDIHIGIIHVFTLYLYSHVCVYVCNDIIVTTTGCLVNRHRFDSRVSKHHMVSDGY